MEILTTLTNVGAPGLAIMVGALLWERKEMRAELAAERLKTQTMMDRLIALALEDEPPCPELAKARAQNHGSGGP